MKRIFRIAFTYAGIEGIQKGIYFLTLPILTYYISPNEYGNISIALMLISIFQMIFTFSIDSTIMRYYRRIKNSFLKKVFLGTLFISSILFIFGWIIVFLLIGDWCFGFFFDSFPFYPYGILIVLIVSLKILNLFYITFLKTSQNIKDFSIYYNLYFFVQTALTLLLVVKFSVFSKDILYLSAILVTQILFVVYVFIMLKNYMVFKLNIKILKFCLYYSLPIIPIKIANTINNSIDRYILFNFLGKGLTGIYFLGWQVATAMQVVVLALNSAYVPKFYELYENHRNSNNYQEIYKIINSIVLITIIIEIFALSLYPYLFELLSENYKNARSIVPIFILFFSMNIVYFINTNSLAISPLLNRKKIYGILVGIGVNIIISLILLSKIGFIGVAIGSIVGQFITIIYFIILVKRYTLFKYNNILYIFSILSIFVFNFYIESFLLRMFFNILLIVFFRRMVKIVSTK